MVVLEAIRRTAFDARTGVNRSLRDKQAAARQLAETVPEAPPEGDWKSQLAAANAEYEAMREKVTAALRDIKKTADDLTNEALAKCARAKEEITSRADAEIERIREETNVKIADGNDQCNKAMDAARQTESQRRTELETEYRPKEAALKERIGRAQAMIEQEARVAETRKLAERMEAEAQKLFDESDKLTDALSQLEKLKSSLLLSLPIPGLEVKDGEISVNGVPWDRLNEAVRVGIAIEVAKLCAGKLGLVVVDGLENLDERNYQAFKKAAMESNVQFIVTRVSNQPLAVETEAA
jgi:hypothetical protein